MLIEDIKNHACTKTGCLCDYATYYAYKFEGGKMPRLEDKIYIADVGCVIGMNPQSRVCRFYSWKKE